MRYKLQALLALVLGLLAAAVLTDGARAAVGLADAAGEIHF